jgi:argininosuccinate lyase
MPQKKNWDVMELVRWNSNLFQSYEFATKEIFKNLLSWYNRDYQLTKEPYLKWIKLCLDTVNVCNLVVENLWVNTEKLDLACTDELYATKEAYELVKWWMTFRDAYKIVWKKYM